MSYLKKKKKKDYNEIQPKKIKQITYLSSLAFPPELFHMKS